MKMLLDIKQLAFTSQAKKGPNNCGKTTLMRAISKEQVEGFR